jgi:hypothetical protein
MSRQGVLRMKQTEKHKSDLNMVGEMCLGIRQQKKWNVFEQP